MNDISQAGSSNPPHPSPNDAAQSDPTASLVRSVRRIAQAIDVRSREIARLTGLTLPQLLVLQSIRSLGEVSTSAVSKDVSMSPPTVVAVLDRLEARALISRYRSTSDRRIVHARLTDEGRAALQTAPALLRPDALERWAKLDHDVREQMAQALSMVTELMAIQPVDLAPDQPPSGPQSRTSIKNPRSSARQRTDNSVNLHHNPPKLLKKSHSAHGTSAGPEH